jgi:transcriptional regulator GlxA family with amidase domain
LPPKTPHPSFKATYFVAIYVFPHVEVLDFAGPFEVFTTASRVSLRQNPSDPLPFTVCTVAKSHSPVTARAGLRILPDHGFDTCPQPDLVLIPGGVVDAEMADAEVLQWIRNCSQTATITASVCTGAFLLAKAGLLEGKSATTHWEDIPDLRAQFPRLAVKEDVRWIDSGKVVTSAGIAAGLDMSLHLVSRLTSRSLATLTARQLDIPYSDT